MEVQLINEQNVLGKNFRVYGTLERPLFLAKDVAEWIDYDLSSINKLVQLIDDDEKVRNNVPTLGGVQEMWMFTENGDPCINIKTLVYQKSVNYVRSLIMNKHAI